jgi:hypothetical protein
MLCQNIDDIILCQVVDEGLNYNDDKHNSNNAYRAVGDGSIGLGIPQRLFHYSTGIFSLRKEN